MVGVRVRLLFTRGVKSQTSEVEVKRVTRVFFSQRENTKTILKTCVRVSVMSVRT